MKRLIEPPRKKLRYWTRDELVEFKRIYAITSTADLATRFCRSPTTLYTLASTLGLRKDWARRRDARTTPVVAPVPVVEAEQVVARREVSADHLAYRKRRRRIAVEELIKHGVDPNAAELAIGLVALGVVPAVKIEY